MTNTNTTTTIIVTITSSTAIDSVTAIVFEKPSDGRPEFQTVDGTAIK